MLDDMFAADALTQRALEVLHDRNAAEDIDVMHDSDAIAAVVFATLAVAKRLSVVGDQLADLTRSIDRIGLDAIKRDLHAERVARDRIEAELARIAEVEARNDAEAGA